MIAFGIFVGVVSAVGIVQTARLVSKDGYRHVPARTYPTMFTLR